MTPHIHNYILNVYNVLFDCFIFLGASSGPQVVCKPGQNILIYFLYDM